MASSPAAPPPIVVVGAGSIVQDAHLPAYRRAGFRVAGLYDLDRAKALAVAKRFHIPLVFNSLNQAAQARPDDRQPIFDVAVPAAALPRVLPHLPAGAAVLIQKPFGVDLASARRLLRVCERRRLRAGVNFQLRFAPAVARARELIARGAIGAVHDLEVRVTVFTPWRRWRFLEGTPRVEILYHSIHYIDLVRSFFGEPRGVRALTLSDPASPRLASTRTAILLEYGGGRRATITANHAHAFGARHQESYVKWEGARGAIRAGLGVLLDYPRGRPDTLEWCPLRRGASPRWRRLATGGNWFPDGFAGVMEAAMRLAREGRAPVLATAADAARTMAVVEAAYRSSARGATAIPKLPAS